MAIEDDLEKPLDPAVERIRRKMARLLVVSIAVMMIGLMAVLAAIVYKIGDEDGEEEFVGAEIALPVGAKPLEFDFSDSEIAVRVDLVGAGEAVLVFDRRTGQPSGRYDLPTIEAAGTAEKE